MTDFTINSEEVKNQEFIEKIEQFTALASEERANSQQSQPTEDVQCPDIFLQGEEGKSLCFFSRNPNVKTDEIPAPHREKLIIFQNHWQKHMASIEQPYLKKLANQHKSKVPLLFPVQELSSDERIVITIKEDNTLVATFSKSLLFIPEDSLKEYNQLPQTEKTQQNTWPSLSSLFGSSTDKKKQVSEQQSAVEKKKQELINKYRVNAIYVIEMILPVEEKAVDKSQPPEEVNSNSPSDNRGAKSEQLNNRRLPQEKAAEQGRVAIKIRSLDYSNPFIAYLLDPCIERVTAIFKNIATKQSEDFFKNPTHEQYPLRFLLELQNNLSMAAEIIRNIMQESALGGGTDTVGKVSAASAVLREIIIPALINKPWGKENAQKGYESKICTILLLEQQLQQLAQGTEQCIRQDYKSKVQKQLDKLYSLCCQENDTHIEDQLQQIKLVIAEISVGTHKRVQQTFSINTNEMQKEITAAETTITSLKEKLFSEEKLLSETIQQQKQYQENVQQLEVIKKEQQQQQQENDSRAEKLQVQRMSIEKKIEEIQEKQQTLLQLTEGEEKLDSNIKQLTENLQEKKTRKEELTAQLELLEKEEEFTLGALQQHKAAQEKEIDKIQEKLLQLQKKTDEVSRLENDLCVLEKNTEARANSYAQSKQEQEEKIQQLKDEIQQLEKKKSLWLRAMGIGVLALGLLLVAAGLIAIPFTAGTSVGFISVGGGVLALSGAAMIAYDRQTNCNKIAADSIGSQAAPSSCWPLFPARIKI